MSMTFMHKSIKELFPNYIVLIKVGNFYEAYQDDSLIVSYLLGYRIRTNMDTSSCGFPVVALNKVLSILDRKSISYDVIDKFHNYEEIVKHNYKRKYKELLFLRGYYFM